MRLIRGFTKQAYTRLHDDEELFIRGGKFVPLMSAGIGSKNLTMRMPIQLPLSYTLFNRFN